MKKVLALILFIILLPSVTSAQFTGMPDEVTLPTYNTDSTIINADSNFSGSVDQFNSNSANYSSSTEVNINAVGNNRNCSVPPRTFKGYVDYVGCIIRVAILPFIFTLALLAFVWGVTVMVRHPDNESSQKEGRTFIMWGIIGFFVITSVYALVEIIRRSTGLGANFKNDPTPYVQLREKIIRLK